MQALEQHLQTTLKDIYRKALDADQKLDKLQQQQQGKFNAIFDQQSGFEVQAKRFLPYVEELTKDWEALSNLPENEFKARLPKLVTKMEVMLRTLTTFRTV